MQNIKGLHRKGLTERKKWNKSLINNLICITPRHAKITKTLLLKQITNLNLIADALIEVDKGHLAVRLRFQGCIRRTRAA